MNGYLEEDVRMKLAYWNKEKITESDLQSIFELGLNNYTFADKPKNIDLSELSLFPNLKFLTLQRFQIEEKDLEVLSNLQKLQYLQIVSCNLENENSHEFPALENLVISTSEFKSLSGIICPKHITINSIKSIVDLSSLNGLKNIEDLNLNNIKVRNFGMVVPFMTNLKSLNLDGSKVDDKRALNKLKNKIAVSHEKESYNIR